MACLVKAKDPRYKFGSGIVLLLKYINFGGMKFEILAVQWKK